MTPPEAEWRYTLMFYGPAIQGRQTTVARTEHQAVRNVVFRIVRQGWPSASAQQVADRALPLASRIYNDKSYQVVDQQLVLPVADPLNLPPAALPVDVPEELKTIRRGLGYPENPDEQQDD